MCCMNADESDLLSSLKRAFATAVHPGWEAAYRGHPAWSDNYPMRDLESEEIEKEITPGMRWEDVSPVVLRSCPGYFLRTAPSAFPFFLAAFLFHALVAPEELDAGRNGLEGWIRSLRADPKSQIQFESLSLEQKKVLCEFMDYFVVLFNKGMMFPSPGELTRLTEHLRALAELR